MTDKCRSIITRLTLLWVSSIFVIVFTTVDMFSLKIIVGGINIALFAIVLNIIGLMYMNKIP